MGMDPLSIKFIRLAHEAGLGCGDPRDIEIVGDTSAASENWHFVGPFKKMTFASRMQHRIYWGPLKKPLEWSLKTVLAPWSYIASVLYHDTFWYPMNADRMMKDVLSSEWGRLFQNWTWGRRRRWSSGRAAGRSRARSACWARASSRHPSSPTRSAKSRRRRRIPIPRTGGTPSRPPAAGRRRRSATRRGL
jgi:hypothetical protein